MFLLMILMLVACGEAEDEAAGKLSAEELEAISGLLPKIDRMLSAMGNEEMVAVPLDAKFLDRVLAACAEQDRDAPVTEAALANGGPDVMEKRSRIATRHGFKGLDDLLVAEMRVQRAYYYGVLERNAHVAPSALRAEIDVVGERREEVYRTLQLAP